MLVSLKSPKSPRKESGRTHFKAVYMEKNEERRQHNSPSHIHRLPNFNLNFDVSIGCITSNMIENVIVHCCEVSGLLLDQKEKIQ